MVAVVNIFIKFFFLLTPFFGLSMFLALTRDRSEAERKRLAVRVAMAVWAVCLVVYLIGNYIFQVFGITLDAFRIGTGALLFITALGLSQGRDAEVEASLETDFVVVPLAVPVLAGPATIGTLLVMSGEETTFLGRAIGLGALTSAIAAVGTLLYVSASIERLLSKRGLVILSKITGLVLSALAAQMVFTGVRAFLR